MKIQAIYIANDGQEFDTEKECAKHEILCKELKNSDIILYDKNLNIIKKSKNIERQIIDCRGFYVPNDSLLQKIKILLTEPYYNAFIEKKRYYMPLDIALKKLKKG
jgi:hypothetical protein